MPTPPMRRKRRVPHGPNKNELKVNRGEAEERERSRAGTLRARFPDVNELKISLRLVSTAGATLEENRSNIGKDEPLILDVPCPGGCGNGSFLLTEAIEQMLSAHREHHEGLGLCRATSYVDPNAPCSTKLYYAIDVVYGGE